MTIFPTGENNSVGPFIFGPVMDSFTSNVEGVGPVIYPNFAPSGVGGNLIKPITNVRLVQENGLVQSPNPFPVYTVSSGPSGKLSIFLKRFSGTVDGKVALYGAFKLNAESSDKVAIVEDISWTDRIEKIVTDFDNPFSIILIHYSFENTDDVAVELNFSSY